MVRYFDFAAKTPVLVATFVGTVVLLALFQAIPVGGELLDVRQGYGHDEAMAALAGYGADGRRVYAWSSATVDTVLPCVLVTLLAGLVYRFRPTQDLGILACVPLSVGLLDLAENAQIIGMLVQFPDISARQVAVASATTIAKTFAALACFGLVAILVGFKVLRRLFTMRGSDG